MAEEGLKKLARLRTLEGIVERHSRIAELLSIAYTCIEHAKCLVPVVPVNKPNQLTAADQVAMKLADAADSVHEVLSAAQNVVNRKIR